MLLFLSCKSDNMPNIVHTIIKSYCPHYLLESNKVKVQFISGVCTKEYDYYVIPVQNLLLIL